MCNPTLVISALATGAGVAMQNASYKDANRTKAMMMKNNAERNRALEDSQRAAIQGATNVAGADAGKVGMDNAATVLSEVLKSAIVNNRPQSATTSRAPKIVQDAEAAAMAVALKKAENRANSIARLDGINTYLGNTVAPKIADSAAQGGMVGNFMRGNSNVLNSGLQFAESKAVNPIAQLLIGGGKVGAGYGLYSADGLPKDEVIQTETG